MGAGYASSCGCNIAERFGPGRGVQEWLIIHSGMARRHGNGVNYIRTACIFRHSVHLYLHVQQALGPIYVDGAIRTAATCM